VVRIIKRIVARRSLTTNARSSFVPISILQGVGFVVHDPFHRLISIGILVAAKAAHTGSTTGTSSRAFVVPS
jgi:hypothetical protein